MTPSTTESQTLAQVKGFLTAVLPSGVAVFKGQANQVPEPQGSDFIVMTPNIRARLATTVQTWDQTDPDPSTVTFAESTRVEVQLDFHGETSTDNAQVVTTLWRSSYAVDFMADSGVTPLYCDDGHQVPFINSEGKYEDRWIINAVLQVTPVITTPAQFADTLTVGLIEVDTRYPPGE